jgi:hypothetical protein
VAARSGSIVLQLVGATLACLSLWAVLGKVGSLGATEPGAGIQDWQAMLIELAAQLEGERGRGITFARVSAP